MEIHDSDSKQPDKESVPEIDQMKLQMFMQQIKDNQNLSLGVLAGAGAAILGAAAWAAVTAISGWQIGFMAIGVGYLVGYAVRMFGNGVDTSFGIAGATLSLLGCVTGNLLAVCIFIGQEQGIEVMDILSQLDFAIATELIVDTSGPMDLLFYGFAVYYGYKNSFRKISEEEMATLVRP